MESEILKSCQWKPCGRSAAKHVVFATRVFDPAADIHVSEISDKPQHLDLCPHHIELISLQYIHVVEYELYSCPPCNSN